MAPSRREKLQAHAEHLLDVFLGLRGTYAMLEPILFDRVVIDRWGSGKRGAGLHVLTYTLMHACVLAIAKIALDKDPRTPSVKQLAAALDDTVLLTELREAYAVWKLPDYPTDDAQVQAMLQRLERREEQERRDQFDQHVEELRSGWAHLKDSSALVAFATMRDKLIAHSELWHDGRTYRPVDVAALGLKFGDLRTLIERLQTLIDRINLIYRRSSFAFDLLDKQLTATKNDFWLQTPTPPAVA